MSLIRILFINLVTLTFLLIIVEISFRLAGSIKDCLEGERCDFYKILYSRKIDNPISFGLVENHPVLGYVPAPNWEGYIESPYWNNSYISISEKGFRNNKKGSIGLNDKILALGDSFTFGNQVSDFETWPACLEEKLSKTVLNGGMFGYGAAQSVLRGQYITEERQDISNILFSVLVGDDVFRDTLSYRSGYAKPYLDQDEENQLKWKYPASFDIPGTKGNPRWNILQYSYFYTYFSQKYNIFPDLSAQNLSRRGSYGIGEDQIIQFVIDELNEINIEFMVILQYPRHLRQKQVLEEREKWIKLLNQSDIKYLDTYEVLANNINFNDLWYGHHTVFGNSIICEAVFSSFKKYSENLIKE